MKYNKERFDEFTPEAKIRVVHDELRLVTHNATTRDDLLMLLQFMYDEFVEATKPETTGTVHKVKILPEFIDEVTTGKKPFELRKNDRGYKKGDILELCEWDGKEFTGYKRRTLITYVLENYTGLEDGYCILGISVLSRE